MGQYKDFRYSTWTIVNNRFCWLLGVVAKIGVILRPLSGTVMVSIRKF